MGIEGILERLIMARTFAGLSQAQAAKLMGFDSASTISHYESGLRSLTVENLLKMVEIYGANLTWVMTGVNPNFDPARFYEVAKKGKMAADELDKLMDLLEAIEQ